MKAGFCLLMTTVPDLAAARRIGRKLVQERLAACVSSIPGAISLFTWKGKTHEEKEVLLLIKTRSALRPSLQARLKKIHPYEVPELLFFRVDQGEKAYLDWVLKGTRAPQALPKKRR